MQRTWTSKAAHQGWWQSFLRALARTWLTIRYQVLDRRHGRIVLETIDSVPLIVLPGVFNPVLFRSGEFMARVITSLQLPLRAQVLDLGTGSGVGAIFAARQGAQVTAVDINPEAARCAQINSLLNDLAGRITVVEGDLFTPVKGQQFDLVLFNPPYYRGRPADDPDHAWRSQDIFERFASELVSHLTPAGRSLIVLSSDGDGDQLLTLLRQAKLAVRPLAHKNLINEILTIYEVKPGAG